MKLSTLNSQLKTALLCLAIAICARFAIDTQLQAQTDRNQHLLIEPANVGPAGISVDAGTARFHMLDDQGVFQPPWLIVQRPSQSQYGYEPDFTYALSDYKPTVRQLANGKWQITFSENLQ